jgi:hypothetical protein
MAAGGATGGVAMARHLPHPVWRVAARITVLFGLGCAIGVWGLLGPVATVVVTCIPVAFVTAAGGRKVSGSVRLGWNVALVLVASGGLVAACGWAGVLLLAIVTSTSPLARIALKSGPVLVALRRGVPWEEAVRIDHQEPAASHPEPVRGSAPPPLLLLAGMPAADGVASLDDHALCEAWRRSYVCLEACSTTAARHEVVRRRQLYLDELIRRHPAEARRWLEAGARAAGNPLPFLERPTRDRRLSQGGGLEEMGPGVERSDGAA